MKEIFLQYACYNVWANKAIIDVLLQMEEDKIDEVVQSSFPSLRKTVYHIWSAEYIWLQRLLLTERPLWVQDVYDGSFEEACARWQEVSSLLKDFVSRQYDDKAFTHVFQYYNLKKQSVKNPVSRVLMHVFNHATYHRGQLVTIMRTVGVTKIPCTDFITFIPK